MVKKTKRSTKWVRLKPIKVSKYAGIHLLADFWSGKIIEDPKKLEKILIEAAKKAKNDPLEITIHKFNPQGITGVLLLAESHIAFHSWPEINYIGIDIFTCGEKAIPYRALGYLKKEFKPKKIEVREIKRGILGEENKSSSSTSSRWAGLSK
jgi:S-adenosylmethionine decarboxylase